MPPTQAASHGPAGTSSTASSDTPEAVITSGSCAPSINSFGQSTVSIMTLTLPMAYDSFPLEINGFLARAIAA
jgi:hypothetical protein